MNETKQVDKDQYEFLRYMSKARWNSLWHQLDEVIRLKPERVLEIGPGLDVFKNTAGLYGVKVETLDIDPELKPDHVGSATALPFDDNSFDVVCAFQMLEHLPYETALQAFREMTRVSRGHIVISLPDAKPVWRYLFYLPKIGNFDWLLPRPFARMKTHHFDGEHHWEINKRGYPLEMLLRDLCEISEVIYTYRVKEKPFHRFLVLAAK
ncbi:MAG: class I SAM-dependent methyltransferase [Candidatus Electrothrix sp. GW3-4]|uniref:class I SAM-dependent methyltransferase n=1 Tax=Candidatus Electrothrix sp. GW3-4 TaxID=3126740 RepID=UPI0030CB5535